MANSSNPGSILSNVPSVSQPKDEETAKPINKSNARRQLPLSGFIYLSHHGLCKMLEYNRATGYTPLENFIASLELKRLAQLYLSKNVSKLFNIKIVNEISPVNYASFTLKIQPNTDQIQASFLEDYFNNKILCPPFKTSSLTAFFFLLFTQEFKNIKDFIQLLEFESVNIFIYYFKTFKNVHMNISYV